MNSLVGVEPRFRMVNLMADEPEMRELRAMVERRLRASGYAGTREDPVPIAVVEQAMDAAVAEFNALVGARAGLSSARVQ